MYLPRTSGVLHVLFLLEQCRHLLVKNENCSYELCTDLTEHELTLLKGLEDLYIQEDQNAVFMCEVSLEDVTGEWYRDGHRIRPSSTVKTRTEGQRSRGGRAGNPLDRFQYV